MMIENFVNYAMKSYVNPNCVTVDEFKRDLEKISLLNKLFTRYYIKNDLNVRLILNHVVILYNVFEPEACTEMLFYKIREEYWSGLKTVLTYLNYMPDRVQSMGVKDCDIPIDENIARELREI